MKKNKKRRLFFIYITTILLLILLFLIPLPYVLVFPGKVVDLGEVVSINISNKADQHFYAASSRLYFNPYAKILGLTDNNFNINLFMLIIAKSFTNAELIRVSKGYNNLTTEQIDRYYLDLTEESNKISKYLSLKYLRIDDTIVNISIKPLSGPSGNLMTTLEIINQLGKDDIVKGRKIAGTGVLNESGDVLAIGGINQKIYAAEKNGVEIIMVPEANKEEVSVKTQLKIIYVKDLLDAIRKLR